jgi:hypothetical protein
MSKAFERSRSDKLLFFVSMKTLGMALDQVLNLNPKLFMNKDLKDSLVNLMHQIQIHFDFEDKLCQTIGKKEWVNLFSLFLIVCELGHDEKVHAYTELNTILHQHPEIVDVAACGEFFVTVFKDTVSDTLEITQLALEVLNILVKNQTACQELIFNNLVYNLITKVAQKHPQNNEKINEILININTHGKALWDHSKLEKEKTRIKSISKTCELKSILDTIKYF